MKYFSMFSGIGGFELGIYRSLNIPDKIKSGSNVFQIPICVGFSEIDKYAIQIYKTHFKEHKNYGDATRIVPESIPDFDLLVGGFPCQAFSIAGKRLGFDDTRGTLFFDIARILKVKRPRMFLLENVKGLLSHDNGRTFKTIITTLAELGYGVEWQVLNSKNFGVPQNRERVFIIGHLGEFGGQAIFPIGEGNESCDDKESELCQQVSNCLRTNYSSGFSNETYVEAGTKIRRLTPVECERLQGYPDGWTSCVRDSQRYKTLGNSVTVNVIEEIMRRI